MESKKKIIYTLIVFTSLLLLLNVVLGMLDADYEPLRSDDEIQKSEIERTFLNVLKNFGIKDKWVNKKKIRKETLDSVNYKYEIEIPSDVAIPMILKELSQRFIYREVKISSKEKKDFGSASLEIRSGSFIKLIAELNYSKKILRPHSSVAFILKNIEDLNETEFSKLLKTPIKFGVLLPLRIESIPIAEKILKSKRAYYIYLDDDADKPKFELDEDLNVNTLNKNIRSIVSSFNTPKYFFVSKRGTGYSNSFINYLKEEFKKKNRKVLNLKLFINLKGENNADLNSLLNFHLNKVAPGKSKMFFIDVDDWETIQQNINSYLKKGNRVILPYRLL